MKLEPLGNYLVIQPIEIDKTTDGGIVLPDTIGEPSSLQGTIVAAGPGESNMSAVGPQLKPLSVKVGDKVLFRKQRFEKLELDGKVVYLGNEENIWAKITE